MDKKQQENLLRLLASKYPENHYIALNIIKHFEQSDDIKSLFPSIIDSFEKFIIALEVGFESKTIIGQDIKSLSIWCNPNRTYHHAVWIDNNSLDFSTQHRVTIIPEAICKLKNLEQLHLQHQRISKINKAIKNLTQLKVLNLTNNQSPSFPLPITTLSNLETLNINDNQIAQIPDSIKELSKLKQLKMNGNAFWHFPTSICHLPVLEILHLSTCGISSIPDDVVHLQTLEHLDISHNLIKKLPHKILELPNLKTIACKNNPFYKDLPTLSIRNKKCIEGKFGYIQIR